MTVQKSTVYTEDMAERTSSIHRALSDDPEWNAQALTLLDTIFARHSWWPSEERAKTNEERAVIRAIVPRLQKFLEQYGAEPLELTARHVQVVDKDRLDPQMRASFEERVTAEKGMFNPDTQRVGVPMWQIRSLLDFALVLVHEFVHFHSFAAVRRDSDGLPSTSRVGLQVFKSLPDGSKRRFFNSINEAVTEELTRRFWTQLKEIPLLREEIARVEEVREKTGDPHIASFPMWSEETAQGVEYVSDIQTFSYPRAREHLWELIAEIDTAYPGRFPDKESIFAIFARAAMTGDVREMAELVEGLGSGRLRELARVEAKG